MSILFYIGLLLLGGLLFGRLAKFIGLPNVTGYLVAGLILGPYALKIISLQTIADVNIVAEMALGFIALSIGAEFKLSYLKQAGKEAAIIAVLAGVLAAVLVTGGLVLVGVSFPMAILLGAIASATAPAATVMVIKQYNAKGPVSKTLLSVVAIDDAVALIAFGFAVAIAKISVSDNSSIVQSIFAPFKEIGLSVILGVAFALLLLIPLHFFKKQSNRLCGIVGILFATIAVSNYLEASSLLTCMILGTVIVNISKDAKSVFDISDTVTPPIYMLFFVVSGAQLNVALIPSIGVIGVVYIIMRVIGKVAGSWLGAVISKSSHEIKNYLGWTLLPQAGVAIGLTIVADKIVPEYANQIRAVVLCSVLIYELTGPVITKLALTKAGEIKPVVK